MCLSNRKADMSECGYIPGNIKAYTQIHLVIGKANCTCIDKAHTCMGTAKAYACGCWWDLHVYTWVLAGALTKLFTSEYAWIRYTIPGASPISLAWVTLFGTCTSIWVPTSGVCSYVTRYPVATGCPCQITSTASSVTPITVRFCGGITVGWEEIVGKKVNGVS